MLVYLLIILNFSTIFYFSELIIKKALLTEINSMEKILNYRDGIIIFICLVGSFALLHSFGMLTTFKLIFFLAVLFSIFILCLIDDAVGGYNIYGCRLTIHTIIKIGIVIITFYIYYCLNEEYWPLKGLLTFLFIDISIKTCACPTKLVKVTLIYFLILGTFYLRWTQDLYYITMLVILPFYLIKGFKSVYLGKNGSGLVGLILGLLSCEAFSSSVVTIIIANLFMIIFRYKEVESLKVFTKHFIHRQIMFNRAAVIKVFGNKYNK
jgi:hypothetical protein